MVICYIPLKEGLAVKHSAHGLLAKARKLSSQVTALVVHCGIQEEDIRLDCDEMVMIRLSEREWPVSSCHIQAISSFQRELSKEGPFLFTSSPLTNEITVGLAARSGSTIINQAMDITMDNDRLIVKRELYGGKACTYEYASCSNYISIDPAFLNYYKTSSKRPVSIRHLDLNVPKNDSIQFIKNKQLSWKEIGLTEASCVIGIGRGVYQTPALDQIEILAEVLNAPIGGSKVADELQLIPRERRIGSSGITIAEADIYIAIGISGSSQHLEGIKNVKHVLAINNDAAAPIFKRCDIGIISRYENVLPQLIAALKNGDGVKNIEDIGYTAAGV
ncbi:electron transfer flavoprotein subunit alpha/FixB family protein [Pseudalkalibacillus decolorationis]|uniref:electron transfer flavoprotein subunit alpha/FixB family protein n=1 Tax=Pseudalkalibacillus decolorationis TaxID=163879 RepID=UPI002148AB21|nr:electron transfer flavoprotein subunit alpha/FixB family protein [Pseudalkalibacillus decolorationis]